MQVTETLNKGLKREIRVVVPAEDLEARLTERLADARGKVRLNGFRPGKVPSAHLRKMYGKSFMAEVINEILENAPRSILAERGERSAMRPEIGMNEDEEAAGKVLDGRADFIFSLSYEVLPGIEIRDVSGIEVTREIVDVSDAEIDGQVERALSSTRTYTKKKGKAGTGDRVTIDYVGKLGDEPFEGGADQDAQLVLGSGMFIKGFEEQLTGTQAGDEIQITVTFPENYNAAHLAGRQATFDVKVKEVASPDTLTIDDEAAKKLGIESLARLREIVKGQIENQYGAVTRQKVKRQILDVLDREYQTETPEKLVELEFNNIWRQINAELQQAGRSFEDEGTTEKEARGEYHRLAERRVRLGLVLSVIGEQAGVTVSDEELQRAIYAEVRKYPGQEKEIVEFFRRSPDAVANLRAPIFEEKVVDYLLGKIRVIDKKVTSEELLAVPGEDEEKIAASKKKTAGKRQEKTVTGNAQAAKKSSAGD